jgi:hypothetical protein
MITKGYKTLTLLVCLCISISTARRSPPSRPIRLPSPGTGGGSGSVRVGRWAAWTGSGDLNSTIFAPNSQFANFNVYPNKKVANLTLVVNCHCEGTAGIYSSLTLRQHKDSFIPGTINARGRLESSFLDQSEALWNEGPMPGWSVGFDFDFRRKTMLVVIDHREPDVHCYASADMRMKEFGLPYWGSGLPIGR